VTKFHLTSAKILSLPAGFHCFFRLKIPARASPRKTNLNIATPKKDLPYQPIFCCTATTKAL